MKNSNNKVKIEYILLLPTFFIIALVAFYPLLSTFFLSLKDLSLKTPWINKGFIFFANYIKAFSSPRFLQALVNTVIFTFSSVLLEFVFGLMIALLIHRYTFAKGLVRASILLPWAIPTVVSAQMWRWLWHDKFGLINFFLHRLHLISENIAWLAKPSLAMIAVIIADVWKTTPFMALLLLSGLAYIPNDLYEAARVDGASWWQSFKRITFPLLMPAVFVALLFRSIDAFRVFDMIYVMTKGGPGNSTEVLSLYAYKTVFGSMDFGYGSALCVITFLCVLCITFIYSRIFRIQGSIDVQMD